MVAHSELKPLCISGSQTLLDAMKAITLGVSRIALVTDSQGILQGILVDGDIRKALINGAQLNSLVKDHMNKNFFSVGPEMNRVEILELMKARLLGQVPIVDKNKKLLGLHLIHEVLGGKKRENCAFIMAGGRGTRLGSLTKNYPKPMLQVGGRPILERLVLLLTSYGIKKIYISVNYLSHVIEDFFQDGKKHGCQIIYVREEEAMGSGGALSLLPEIPTAPMLVLNGDLVTDINLHEMFEFHNNGSYAATMGIWKYVHEVPYGCVDIENNSIKTMAEKPLLEKNVNAGVYILNPEVIKLIPQKFFPMTDLFSQMLEQNKNIGAYLIKEGWLDIGLPTQLEVARTGV